MYKTHTCTYTQDQISGLIWHGTYLKLLEQPGFKDSQVCANFMGFKFFTSHFQNILS